MTTTTTIVKGRRCKSELVTNCTLQVYKKAGLVQSKLQIKSRSLASRFAEKLFGHISVYIGQGMHFIFKLNVWGQSNLSISSLRANTALVLYWTKVSHDHTGMRIYRPSDGDDRTVPLHLLF